jgi:FlaA1/EpsC-like NDP-sugar epimerase
MTNRNIIPLFRLGQVAIDILLVLVVYVSVFIVRFEGQIPTDHIKHFWFFLPIIPFIRISVNYFMGLYYHLWKYFGMREMLSVFYSTSLGSILFVLIVYLTNNSAFPRSIFLFEWALVSIAFLIIRSSKRFSQEIINMNPLNKSSKQRTLIIGAGDAGQLLVGEIIRYPDNTYMPIGFIDDDPKKYKAKIKGIRVFGGKSVIKKVVKDWDIDTIIISIPSAHPGVIKEFVEICSKTKAEIKIIPTIKEILDGDVSVSHLRKIEIQDLLGREPIKLDDSELKELLVDKTILVTGAGGSIGSELCFQLVKYNIKHIILLGHGENSIFKISNLIREKFPKVSFSRVIVDIKDRSSVEKVFEYFKPDLVFHAAAHKHVPLMEENLCEALLNNVYGTKNLVELSHIYKVERFVNISTDKAVEPSSIMGTTKRLAELIVKYYNKNSDTKYMTVRFGNVIGSRGSVIPIFQDQINDGGPVTVTHPEMTRYFMTIPEASQLVMQASCLGKGSEIFVLDMGEPVNITELAKNMIKLSGYDEKDIPIHFSGIREGEKLHEDLFMENELISKTKHEKIMVSYADTENENIIDKIETLISYTKIFDVMNINKLLSEIIPSYRERVLYQPNISNSSKTEKV